MINNYASITAMGELYSACKKHNIVLPPAEKNNINYLPVERITGFVRAGESCVVKPPNTIRIANYNVQELFNMMPSQLSFDGFRYYLNIQYRMFMLNQQWVTEYQVEPGYGAFAEIKALGVSVDRSLPESMALCLVYLIKGGQINESTYRGYK